MKSKPTSFPVMQSLIFLVISPVIYAQTSIQEFDPNTQLTAYSSQPAPAVEPDAPIQWFGWAGCGRILH